MIDDIWNESEFGSPTLHEMKELIEIQRAHIQSLNKSLSWQVRTGERNRDQVSEELRVAEIIYDRMLEDIKKKGSPKNQS